MRRQLTHPCGWPLPLVLCGLQITNQDAERVNRAWAGRPGTLIRQYDANVSECVAAGSSTASGSCMRLGQSACAGAGTAGWIVNAEQQLQAPPAVTSRLLGAGGSSDPPLSFCLSTQSDNAQSWPFTSPIPTSHGKYDGSLHDTGVGNLLANCSAVTKQGNWVRTFYSYLSLTPDSASNQSLVCRRRCYRRASTNQQRHFSWSAQAAIPSASRPHPWPARVPSSAAQSPA